MRKTLYGILASTLVLAVANPVRAAWVDQTFYPGINGSTVAALTNNSKFPNDPTLIIDPNPLINTISLGDPFDPKTVVEGIGGAANNYGSMIQGWLEAPVTGAYTFWVSSSQDSSFYLSTNATVAGQQLVGSVASVAMGPRSYGATPTQRSTYYFRNGITLTKGNKYYFRVLQAQNQTGGDHVSIGWYRPDGAIERPIPVRYVQKFPAAPNGFGGFLFDTQKTEAPSIQQLPGYYLSGNSSPGGTLSYQYDVIEKRTAVLFANVDGTQPMSYQWYKNGAIMTGEVLSSLDVNAATINLTGDQYECQVSNANGNAIAQIRLTVQPDTTPPAVVSAATQGNPNGLSVFFSEPVNPTQATNPANYKLNFATVTGAQLQYGTNNTVIILTTTPFTGAPVRLSVTNVFDLATTPNRIVAPNQTTVGVIDGVIQWFEYDGLGGTAVNDLYSATNRWPFNPSRRDYRDVFSVPSNVKDNYATELKGVLVPPETGNYVFFICADDQAALFLSRDDTAANKIGIAIEPEWADPLQWDSAADRRDNWGGTTWNTWQGSWSMAAAISASTYATRSDNIAHGFTTPGTGDIYLEAGRRYYIEAVMKEGGGGDNLAVTWLRPSQITTFPPPTPANGTAAIPGQYLGLPTVGTASTMAITSQPSDVTVEERFDAVFTVGTVGSEIRRYQWYEDTAQGPKLLPDANDASLRITTIAEDNGRKFFCVAFNAFSKVTSTTNTLTVIPDVTKPRVYRVIGSPDFTTFTVMFTEPVDFTTAQTVQNYRLVRTGQANALGISTPTVQNRTNVILLFSSAAGHAAGTNYTLTVSNVKDQASAQNVIDTTSPTWTGFILSRGFMNAKVWYEGVGIDTLRNWVDTGRPSSSTRLISSYESHYPGDLPERPDNYGQWMFGFIIPPVAGTYQFYIASDDNARFYVSPDANPANKQQIASEPEWNGHREWLTLDRRGTGANRGSFTFPTANVPYYTEYIYQEGGGGDNGAVTWQEPGGAPVANQEAPRLRGLLIGSYQNPDGTAINFTTDLSTTVTNNEGTQRTLTVAAAGSYYDVPDATEIYQWQTQAPGSSTWTDIAGANGTSYTTTVLTPSDTNRKYRCVVFIPGKSQASTTTTMTVINDTVAPVVSQVFGTETLNQIVVRFNERVTPATAGIIGAYGVTGGLVVNNAALQANATDVILTTSPQTPGTQYTVQVTGVKDISVAANTITPNPTVKQFTAWQQVSGWVKRQSWFNASGGAGAVTNNPTRYANPDLVDYMRTFETVDSPDGNRANGGFGREIENWSWQLDGYLTVPTTGGYTFAVSADDNASVWLSTDSSPANLRLICAEPEWNGFRDFNTPDRRNGNANLFPNKTRVNWTQHPQLTGTGGSLGSNITLQANTKYYMRTFTFDGCCGDHISVALTASGLPAIDNNANAIIPQSWMSFYANPDNTVTFTQQPPAGRTVIDGQQTTLTIAATPTMIGLYPSGSSPDGNVQTWAKYQWQYSDDGGTTWTDVPSGLAGQSGRQTASYTTTYLTLAQQARRYRCAVTIPGKTEYSAVSTMTIVPPSLQITKVGADAIVSWPAVPSYVLQSTNALPGGTAGWTDETNNIGLQGTVPMGTYLLTNPAPTGNKFFELKKP